MREISEQTKSNVEKDMLAFRNCIEILRSQLMAFFSGCEVISTLNFKFEV